jgi:putative hydrolase of the HAD superfamily
MKSKYSVIVFDLGNVLLPFDYKPMINKLEKIEKNLGYNFLEFYKNNYHIHRSFEKGELPENEFIELMLSILKNKIDKQTFCSLYSKIFTENKEVSALLPRLKENYILLLLSNTNPIHREFGWKDYLFLKYFDKFILSYEVKSLKPEEKIYRAAESFTKKPSGEHFFIDDVREYADGAKKLGWGGVQFTSYEKLIEDLKENRII